MTDTPDEPEEDDPPQEPPRDEAASLPSAESEPQAPPPPQAAPPPPRATPQPPPAAPPPERPRAEWGEVSTPAARPIPWLPILAAVTIVLAMLVAGVFAWRAFAPRGPQEETYVVQPYRPTTELITARDRIEARAEPDDAARVVVIFGQGVTLNVSGRVQRGLGNDWYAIAWNNQTAFVRTQDAVAGSGAPPTAEVRERQPEEDEDKEEEKPDDLTNQEEQPTAPAPSGAALGVGDVNWVREPSARDFARFFPDEALEDGQSGNVTLSCIIGGSGRLACSVASESPSGYGFGQAAIGISRQLRVRSTLPDGSSAEGREMQLPLSFRAN
jgi:TonB family protein